MSELKAVAGRRRSGLRVDLAYRLARLLIARRQAKRSDDAGPGADCSQGVTGNWDAYMAWRYEALREQFARYFGEQGVAGKAALDFGCGDGGLCMVLMDAGAQSVHGIDIDDKNLERFAERLARHNGERRPTFSRSTVSARIDVPDEAFDSIYCLDVLEHVMDYRAIIPEWHRVLRPGGNVYISWQPYWHPYGHHAYEWAPIPWIHALLHDDELTEVCARIVDWPEFEPPVWDRNPDGTRLNRFRILGAGDGYLNKLTVREFERHCKDAGFTLQRREFHPFTWPQPAKAISAFMTRVPMARDFFMACAVYQLLHT